MTRRALLVPLLAWLVGCSASDVFVGDRREDPCDGAWPVCSFRAGCELTDREFIGGTLPASRRFVVETRGPATIRVTILFLTQESPGTDTELHWYEPGCFERYSFVSEGNDVFRLAGDSGILELEREVFEQGDHLVELFSDSVGEFLLKVDVIDSDE